MLCKANVVAVFETCVIAPVIWAPVELFEIATVPMFRVRTFEVVAVMFVAVIFVDMKELA